MNSKPLCGKHYKISERFPRALVLIGLLAIILAGCKKEEPPPPPDPIRPVKTMTLSMVDAGPDMTLPGKVRASQRVDLAFQVVGGRLVELPIQDREGEMVSEGDLLARISPKDFQVDLRNAQGRLAEAKAALSLAQKEYQRVVNIKEKDPGAISQAMVDRRLEAVNQNKGRIRSLRASVDEARNRLGYTYLKAPFAGVIAKRYVDKFQEVKPKQPIVSLQKISAVEVLVDVPENIIALTENDADKVTVRSIFPTAPDKELDLSFKEISTDADPATQTYQVTFQMPQPEGINVLPGMTATVLFTFADAQVGAHEFLIPAIAVVADPGGQSFVWILDDEKMTAHRREVTVGNISGNRDILVRKGLNTGDIIITAGVLNLQEGIQVRRWDAQ